MQSSDDDYISGSSVYTRRTSLFRQGLHVRVLEKRSSLRLLRSLRACFSALSVHIDREDVLFIDFCIRYAIIKIKNIQKSIKK